MNPTSEQLISELIERTREHLNWAEHLRAQPEMILNRRPSDNGWSALECLEHLNLYGKFYLPEIERRIRTGSPGNREAFSSGVLGNYFANSMLPKEKPNKMKTFKSMNPLRKELDKKVVDKFIYQQKKLLDLLDKARAVDLQKTKTSISISRLIRLRLGDTFRFLINHNIRHIAQANRAMQGV